MMTAIVRNSKFSSPPLEGRRRLKMKQFSRGVGHALPMILVLTLAVAAQCVKKALPVATCQRVYVLADYYRLDTVYLRTDSLWPWGRFNNAFCGRDTLVFDRYPSQPIQVCGTSELVAIRYVIGNKVTQSKTFK